MQYNPIGEYTQRFNKVLDFIDRHLAEPVDLAALADVAHFSPFHFHRLFRAWMGETLGDYLRRRRLEVAALYLMHRRRKSVLEVALEVGFGSGEAFSRAFRLQFGVTPSLWRKSTPQRWADSLAGRTGGAMRSNPDQPLSKIDQAHNAGWADHGAVTFQEFSMEIEIVNLPPTRVAYMRHIGPYGPGIGLLWQQKFLPWRAAQGLDNAACYGVGHDDPDVTPAERCRYDACVAVPDDFVAHNPIGSANLPGGRYAVARFRGDAPAIGVAWRELLREWLPASGMQPDGRPLFEYYPADACHDPETGVFECQLCLPVKPL